ncbi:Uncharacterised protein [Serratia odorifera]|uniref:Uncharacterized protein n=1 Tax=Serratia odorifera TaxID=618 RepID=A0A3S4DQH3_SEROD|nr:Uncharacterised protein [Serratia odorifera]
MRDVATVLTVIVDFSHRQRVERQITRDVIHDLLDRHHPLRTAEAAVSGVRRGVGLATVTGYHYVLQKVGIIGMKHCAIDNRTGQIQRIAAVAGQLDVDAAQQTVIVKPHLIANVKRVSLAGNQHIVAAIETHFGRSPGEICRQRTQAGRACCLRLLATEAAAHATHVNHHFVHRHPQYRGHQFFVLRSGSALRSTPAYCRPPPALPRHLRFQIKMLLATDLQLAL